MRSALFVALLVAAVAGCSPGGTRDRAQGYVEGDYLNIAPQTAGRITAILVSEGQWVEAGTVLARMDTTEAEALRDSAKAQLAEAEAGLAMSTAEIEQANATLRAADREYTRLKGLSRTQVASESALDEARRAYETARAAVSALESARTASERRIESARALLAQAAWQLEQRTLLAPANGSVDEIFFRPGEVVTAGRPVVALLPPGNLKVVAFVAQASLTRVPVGAKVRVRCDGCAGPIEARVTFVAKEAEYTPPVIYSLETRGKLVYKIEVQPLAPVAGLNVGQPVDLELPKIPA